MKKAKITVIGGSNSAHTIIPLLSSSGHDVNILTRNPRKWAKIIKMQYILPNNTVKYTVKGEATKISNNPADLICDTQFILLSLPVSNYREVLHSIAPFVQNCSTVHIGTIYGQGGFNWMVEEIKSKFNLDKINYFAIGLIPWITRTKEYGKIGINYGPKAVNVVALSDKNKFEYLNSVLLDDLCYNHFNRGKFELSNDFLSLSLSVDNQIIHLSRLYGMYLKDRGIWKNKKDVPLFYKDYDDISAIMLKKLDSDYTLIRDKIKYLYPEYDFKYMLDYLALERLSYKSSNSNIKESFSNSETLGKIPTPVVKNENGDWIINKNHRFFTDDLYYGLAIAKWIAEKLFIEVKTLDEIIYWAQNILEDKIIENGKLVVNESLLRTGFKYGIPSVYGFSSIDDIIG